MTVPEKPTDIHTKWFLLLPHGAMQQQVTHFSFSHWSTVKHSRTSIYIKV